MNFVGIAGMGAVLPGEPVERVKKSFFSLLSGSKGNGPGVIDLAYYAARNACAQAGLLPGDVEVVIGTSMAFSNFTAGTTQLAPRLSWGVHKLLNTRKAYAFDVGVSDMLLGIESAVAYVASEKSRNVLVVGADQFLPEQFLPADDKHVELLSGAGAVVIRRGNEGFRLLGSAYKYAELPAGYMRLDLTYGETSSSIPLGSLHLEQSAECAEKMAAAAEEVLERAVKKLGITTEEIAHFVLPRWGGPFREELQKKLGPTAIATSETKTEDSFLFTSAATIDLMKLSSHLAPEDLVAVFGYSLGFCVGCQLFQWGGGANHAQ